MKNKTNAPFISLAIAFLLVCAFASTPAQTTGQQMPAQDSGATQPPQAPNLQAELGLTPEQIQKWRALHIELKGQEIPRQMKIRQTKRAPAPPMETPNP